MRSFGYNVGAAVMGAICSALALAIGGQLWPMGLHAIVPQNAVIPMNGPCPSGWHHYDVKDGEYLILQPTPSEPSTERALSRVPAQPASHKGASGAQSLPYVSSPIGSPKLILSDAAVSVVLNLCQRN